MAWGGGCGGPPGHGPEQAPWLPHLASSFAVALIGNWPGVPGSWRLQSLYDDLVIIAEERIQRLGKYRPLLGLFLLSIARTNIKWALLEVGPEGFGSPRWTWESICLPDTAPFFFFNFYFILEYS